MVSKPNSLKPLASLVFPISAIWETEYYVCLKLGGGLGKERKEGKAKERRRREIVPNPSEHTIS